MKTNCSNCRYHVMLRDDDGEFFCKKREIYVPLEELFYYSCDQWQNVEENIDERVQVV